MTIHQDGLLALRLRPDGTGRTAVVRRRQRFPLRTTVAMYPDARDRAMAFVYVQNPTGGVFAGDRLRIEIAAEANARVHLTSQSATKLCRSDTGESGTSELHVELGDGAYLEHVPDPLIPHRGSRYRQRTEAELGEGAAFVATETLAPGRLGERFDYGEVALRTVVRRRGEELCVDALRLDRGLGARAGVLGPHTWLATLLAVSPDRDGEALAARLDAALAGEPGVLAAAGVLPHGCGATVRVLAGDAQRARRALHRAWAETRDEYLGLPLPPLRK